MRHFVEACSRTLMLKLSRSFHLLQFRLWIIIPNFSTGNPFFPSPLPHLQLYLFTILIFNAVSNPFTWRYINLNGMQGMEWSDGRIDFSLRFQCRSLQYCFNRQFKFFSRRRIWFSPFEKITFANAKEERVRWIIIQGIKRKFYGEQQSLSFAEF